MAELPPTFGGSFDPPRAPSFWNVTFSPVPVWNLRPGFSSVPGKPAPKLARTNSAPLFPCGALGIGVLSIGPPQHRYAPFFGSVVHFRLHLAAARGALTCSDTSELEQIGARVHSRPWS